MILTNNQIIYIMKGIDIKPIILLLVFTMTLGFTSCNDDESTVTPKTLEQYKSETLAYINAEITTATDCVLGFNIGDFKASTSNIPNFEPYKANYLKALNTAKTNVEKSDVTISGIIKAQSSLTASGKAFNDSRWNSDRRVLNDLVVELTSLNSATTVGTSSGMVSQTAKDALATAITAAKSVRDSSFSIQRLVDDAVKNLIDAKATFQAAINK